MARKKTAKSIRGSDDGATASSALDAVNKGIGKADGDTAEDVAEEAEVKARFKGYTTARKFDAINRKQFAKDRRYAAGKANVLWAVDTNLVGAFIDILCSTLYARNPDVSIRKAPQVDDEGTQKMEDFAKTSELVVSRLWLDAKLKQRMRRVIRSVLSVGQGWLKMVFVTEKKPRPELNAQLNDLQTKLENLRAARDKAADPDSPLSDDEMAVEEGRIEALKDAIQKKMELATVTGLKIDFVRAEDMQVSLDVATLEEYEEADWCANAIYVLKDSLLERFPDLKEADVKTAKEYFQKQHKERDGAGQDAITPMGDVQSEHAEMFTTGNQSDDSPPFAKVVEQWDRTVGNVYTMIEGVKCWAKDPYVPDYAASRFIPYFYFSFFEVDDQRFPQSLAWRLSKLQDEYACSRSNFRLTRERSISGIVVNASQMSDVEIKKLADSKQQEIIALKLTNPDGDIRTAFAPKPVGSFDPRVFDNQPILQDMERVSGVQEALAAATQTVKTATEASIQQTGFQARTGADRDTIETAMVEMAQWTLEQALQCMTIIQVQRIGGPKSFWPGPKGDGQPGMDITDLLTMVNVSIFAGTTGKPKSEGDKQAWSVVLPLLRELLVQIQQAAATGNIPLSKALTALLKETFRRMSDDIDVDQFIPQGLGDPPPTPPPPPPEIKISLAVAVPELASAQISEIALAALKSANTPPPDSNGPAGADPMQPPGQGPGPLQPPGGSPEIPGGAAPPTGP